MFKWVLLKKPVPGRNLSCFGKNFHLQLKCSILEIIFFRICLKGFSLQIMDADKF